MKAAIYTEYGPPENVKITTLPRPVPQAKEVLIKVKASTVNRTDCGFRSAEYFISRFWSGLFKPNKPVLGCDFAGEIAELGDGVTQYKVGDKVFGFNDKTFGGHQEYLIQAEDAPMDFIPEGISFETAAALTEGSHYALFNIRASGIKPGQKAMVYGATGAIGSAALQLLKSMDIWVTAVCPTKQVELIKSIGADEVFDFQTQDFRTTTHRFDLVIDAVGKSSFGECKKVLVENGIYISTELGKNWENVWLPLMKPLMKGPSVMFPLPVISKEDVCYLGNLAKEGKFKPLIDRIYPLDQIVEAYNYVETGQKVGNVVLKIDLGQT